MCDLTAQTPATEEHGNFGTGDLVPSMLELENSKGITVFRPDPNNQINCVGSKIHQLTALTWG